MQFFAREKMGASTHLLDSNSRARSKRSSRDGVDPDAELSASLPGKNAGVGLELGLGGRHAATVSRNNALRRQVSERNSSSTLRHDRAEMLQHGNHGVGGSRGSSEVTSTGGLEQGLGDLRGNTQISSGSDWLLL